MSTQKSLEIWNQLKLDVIAVRIHVCLYHSFIVKLSKHLIFYCYFSAQQRMIFAFGRRLLMVFFLFLFFAVNFLFILDDGIFLINNLQLWLLSQSSLYLRPDSHSL